jgi:DegV family protein with EDD domain
VSDVRVVTDSAADLPPALAARHGITVVPLVLRFGDDELDDGVLSEEAFLRRMEASPVLPETSSPPPGRFEAAFRRLATEGASGVVCVTLSGDLSGTCRSAEVAARAVARDLPVHVVDSRSVSMGCGLTAIGAAEAAASGAGAEEVALLAADLAARTRLWAVLDTLENLRKGGRIGGARALLGSVLSVKPVIEVRDGHVVAGERQRTRARAIAHLVDLLRAAGAVERAAVLHAAAPDVDLLVDQVAPLVPAPLTVGHLGAVIATHAGPRSLGLAVQLAR